LEASRYTELNPLRARLVAEAELWPWSSAASQDGIKIKANARGNTFRRKEKLEAHLALAQEQVQTMNAQAAGEDKTANRQLAAQRRAARQWKSRLESALREVDFQFLTSSRRNITVTIRRSIAPSQAVIVPSVTRGSDHYVVQGPRPSQKNLESSAARPRTAAPV
jgi:hypothetical protein